MVYGKECSIFFLFVRSYRRSVLVRSIVCEYSVSGFLTAYLTLEQAKLKNNLFTGQIPTVVGRWTSIRLLDLSANNFAGSSVPTEIANLHLVEIITRHCGKPAFVDNTELFENGHEPH